ncbi:MAG TPA: ATP-dependent helicase HrpB [Candidatus Binatia bacterium]|nr:ATP-dependent helicase HrpB [Candidatus Binatia bacterium]
MRALPIDPLLPDVVAALREGRRLVLRAAPGAGKTTRVPAALLDAGIAGGRAVVVLEPRRIAARAAAAFVARERGGAVGGEVGYRVRFEQRGDGRTRLWFVTEGVFSRRLADDPFLEDVGVVVLDEFHERHLQGDVALAVVRTLQESVRPDLRLVVMSATLDTAAVTAALGDAAVLTSEGRAYPVTVEYDESPPAPAARPLALRVAAAVGRLLDAPGDVLVFLPGAPEIRRAAEALAPLAAARGFDVVALHGDQPLDAQECALRPGPRRRVVLATNVAETALTVEGVAAVVDSGLARVARLDPRHGVNVLRVVPISRASADQRAGRAGRTGPGRCVRLWSRAEHAGRRAHETPEILRLDLTRTVLELRAWALGDPASLRWVDPPPPAAVARAERLLARLGALDEAGALTDTGRRMLALPVEPRLARLLLETERAGAGREGALLAALASERDILADARAFGGARADRPAGPSDVLLRMDLFADAARRGFAPDACRALGLDPRAVRAVERARRQLARLVPSGASADPAALRRAILAGFPDRVARRRAPGSPRALMVGGTGVALAPESVVREAELFVAVDLDHRGGPEAVVRAASAVEREWLPTAETRGLAFDAARGRVVERITTRYEDVVLAETVRTDVDRPAAGAVLADVVRADPVAAGVVGDAERALVARLRFLARAMPELEWPEDPDALVADAAASLARGCTTLAELRGANVAAAVLAMLGHRERAALAREAPAEHRLPSGRTVRVRYEPDRPPAIAARIQELFGLAATPRLAAGRVALVVELLAPSGRPVQVTDDLASFWRTTYREVRKLLRGRYPKHDWPEDPLAARPSTRSGRPRGGPH